MNTGLFKTIIILAIFFVAIIFPFENFMTIRIALYISIPVSFFGLLLPYLLSVSGLSFNLIYEKPLWSSKLNERNPLTYIHFIGFMFISAGVGGMIGGYVFDNAISYISVLVILFGICSLIGIFLSLINKRKN